MSKTTAKREIAHYFEYSNHGIEVVEDGLQEISFGEFLVELSALDRAQLLLALQLQDQRPGRRIGECIAALGFMPLPDVQRYLERWNRLDVVVI
ncbi:MAG TPA: hypothetical protein VML75_25395 [Kofleriaceae bacterium]|nr:hypothetical protein [Kofleriaceae bacterium]